MKNIVFYNQFHNGDIHVSRTFIKDISERLNVKIYYHHGASFNILKDLNIIQSNDYSNKHFKADLILQDDDNIYFNTWYNIYSQAYRKYNISLKTLYENFKILYDFLKLEMYDLSYYIPEINFKAYDIDNIDNFFKSTKFKFFVYVSNGLTLSGQSVNFDFDIIIEKLANDFPNILFILSNESKIVKNNTIMSKDIILSKENDLNENAYISTFCDIIIGRYSGTYTFSIIKENILSEKIQKLLCICNQNANFGMENIININKKIININCNSSLDDIYNRIKSNLNI
jgi:hypothetical protein